MLPRTVVPLLALAPLAPPVGAVPGGRDAPPPELAPDLLHFAVGRYSLFDRADQRSPELTVEYRFGDREWLPWDLPGLAPQVGVMRTADEETFTYLGLHYDFEPWERWHVTPQLDVGHYEPGDGRNLCRDLEFRSGLEISYELAERLRFAVSLRHISNAGLAECNPGAESVLFGLQFAPFPH